MPAAGAICPMPSVRGGRRAQKKPRKNLPGQNQPGRKTGVRPRGWLGAGGCRTGDSLDGAGARGGRRTVHVVAPLRRNVPGAWEPLRGRWTAGRLSRTSGADTTRARREHARTARTARSACTSGAGLWMRSASSCNARRWREQAKGLPNWEGTGRGRGVPVAGADGNPERYFWPSTQLTSRVASSAETCGLAGIGICPQTPTPPSRTFLASLATASGSLAYLVATSL